MLLKLDKLAGASIEQRKELYLHACKYLGSEGDVRAAKLRAGLDSVECIRLFVDIGRKLCLDLGLDQYLGLFWTGGQPMAIIHRRSAGADRRARG